MYVCGPTSYREHRTANIVMSGAREEAGQAGWDSVQRNKAGWSSHPTGSDLTLRKDTPRPPLHSILSQGDWIRKERGHLYTPTGYHCTPQFQKEPTTKAHIVSIWGSKRETGNFQGTWSPLFSYQRVPSPVYLLRKRYKHNHSQRHGPLSQTDPHSWGLISGKRESA